MINILYVIDYLDYGGSEQHLYDLVTNIDRTRFEPNIIYFLGGPLSSSLQAKGFKIRRIPIEKIYSFKALTFIPALVRYIKRNKIQILHTFHVKADIYGTLVGILAHVPVIVSSRRDLGFTRTRKHVLFQNLFIDRFVTSVIVNSKAVRGAVYSRERIPVHKIKLIYNGIKIDGLYMNKNVREEERSRLTIRRNEVVVGTLATFNPVKRYDLILRAAKDLRDNGRIGNIKFLLVGDGITRPDMEQFSLSEGLHSKIIFTGYREDIAPILSAMDIFINFSETEGFSNSILQAMAMSLPVIASDTGGNPEAILNGVNGYLVPPGKYQELSKRIFDLAEAPSLREKMGKANRNKVISSFQIDHMMRQFEQLYCELVN